MPKLSHLFLTLKLACITASLTAKPTTATIPSDTGYVSNNITPFAYNTGEWTLLGVIQANASPYDFYYYKLFQINATNHRYASIYEVSVQGDANYFGMQATYRIRIDKYEVTTGRFDGMEISCISGNPHAAVFYVYNNELWLRATNKWGAIYYRTVADFTGSSPLAAAPFGQTITAPAGYLTSTSSFGLKCDFDNNKYYQLSYQDVLGHQYFRGNINLLSDAATNSNAIRGTNSTWLLGWNGTPGNEDISVGTQDQTGTRTLTLAAGGLPRLKILANGNVASAQLLRAATSWRWTAPSAPGRSKLRSKPIGRISFSSLTTHCALCQNSKSSSKNTNTCPISPPPMKCRKKASISVKRIGNSFRR